MRAACNCYILPESPPPSLSTFLRVMNSQPFNERKPPSSSSSLPVNKQRASTWFSKPSFFFRFKLKPGFLQVSRSRSSSSSSKSAHSSSLSSSDPSLSRAQSTTSTTTSKDTTIYASTTTTSVSPNQPGVKKSSSKVRRTLDAVSSSIFEAPTTSSMIAMPSSSSSSSNRRPIHSTAPQTIPDYRQPIPNFFATIPMVPGVCLFFFFFI